MPEVSVVIPCYNSERYIAEAIQSVLDQTFPDFEIIVVDDGSTDGSRDTIARFGSHVRCFCQEHGGPAKARNRGIRESTGRLIAFLDADDVWFPTKLEKQVQKFRENPQLGMVITENWTFNSGGVVDTCMGKRRQFMEGDIAKNIFLRSGVGTPTVMVSKAVLDTVGLFEETLYVAEDDNLWVRIAANSEVALIEEPLAKCRQDHARLTGDPEQVFRGVEANIEFMSTRYAGVFARIKDVIPLKLARLKYDQGYYLFDRLELAKARRSFMSSLRYHPWNWRAFLYIVVCSLPLSVVAGIRRVWQRRSNEKAGR